jgi:hypothetical protein
MVQPRWKSSKSGIVPKSVDFLILVEKLQSIQKIILEETIQCQTDSTRPSRAQTLARIVPSVDESTLDQTRVMKTRHM